jgi:predicted PurR-regulated permease PerM
MKIMEYAAIVGLAAISIYLLIVGKSILLPLVVAVFVWYLINALAHRISGISLRGRSLPRGLSFAAAILVLIGLLWFVIDLSIGSVGQVAAAAPEYEANLKHLAVRAQAWAGVDQLPSMTRLLEGINLRDVIGNVVSALTGFAGDVITVLIYVAFLLLEQHSFRRKIAALFPDREREALAHRILQRVAEEVETYLWLKSVISLLTALLSYFVLVAAGLNFAEFWAVLIFALSFIPYLGALLSVAVPSLLALVQFGTPGPFLAVLAGLTLVQFAINIFEPRLLGRGLNISPVVMLLSLAVWGSIWGIIGMFLAVPLMVVVMIVFSNFETTRPVAVILSQDGQLRH